MRLINLPARACRLALCVLLPAWLLACGGGGSDPAAGAATSATALAALPSPPQAKATSAEPGLQPQPLRVIDTTRTGFRRLLDIGTTADGGLALAWLARERQDTLPSWTLWLQRLDAQGQPLAQPVRLPYAEDVADPRDVAALVRRDGSVVVAYITFRIEDPQHPELPLSAIRTRHFAADGTPAGTEHRLDARPVFGGNPRGTRLVMPQIAGWRDGRYVVGWAVRDFNPRSGPPAYDAVRVNPDGSPAAPIDRFGPSLDPLRLVPLDEGGWLATVTRLSDMGQLYADIIQIDVPHPLGLPLRPTLPRPSFVLDLRRHGSVLFSGQHGGEPGSLVDPYSLHFRPNGREADETRPLPAMPTSAVALEDGDYVTLWPGGAAARLLGQRYAPRGRPVGAPFATDAVADAMGAGLRAGGMALAWLEATSDGETRLLLQLFTDPS